MGGSGSLGTAAVQFAKALGATVTASPSAKNTDLLWSLRADQVIDYETEDSLKRHAEYDVVFDTFGNSSFGAKKTALTSLGRFVCPVLGLTLLRDMILTGFLGGKKTKFAAAGMSKPEIHREELAEVLSLIESDQFSPVMDRVYPLADLVEAHRYVKTGRK